MKKILFSGLLISQIFSAQTVLSSEGFDVVSDLSGKGWINTNQSNPAGPGKWDQGTTAAFVTGGQTGGDTSFTLVGQSSTVFNGGTISNWLITPVVNVQNGDVFSFYTRKGGESGDYPDRLEFRLSNKGAGSQVPVGESAVGDFSILAVSVNPNLTSNTTTDDGYPLVWTQYSYTVSGLTGSSDFKAAFRYYVTNGGFRGANSSIIGVDTYSVVRPSMAVGDVSASKKNINIYPTVVDRSINIALQQGAVIKGVSIYDVSGRATGLVKSDVVSANHFVVDVANLKQGNYIINVITDKGQESAKFIKK